MNSWNLSVLLNFLSICGASSSFAICISLINYVIVEPELVSVFQGLWPHASSYAMMPKDQMSDRIVTYFSDPSSISGAGHDLL